MALVSMLRLHWLALGLLLLPLPALAQLEVSSITDPIRPDRTPLALTDEVPAIFHLGMDNPASVFANPARAARAKHRFVYGTIRPNFSADQPVSFAALFGSRERRWLITVENGINASESSDTRRADVMRDDPDFTEMQTELRTSESDRVFSSTRARALLIGRTDFGGYAFGLYGGYRNNTDHRLTVTDLDSRLTQQRFSSETEQTISDTRRDVRSAGLDGFGVGAEMALAGRTWDLAAAASYQRRSTDFEFSNTTLRTARFEERFDDGQRFTRFDQSDDDIQTRADATPSAVDFEVLGTIRAGRERDDYLFGSVTGTFGSGTADAILLQDLNRIRRTDDNGTISGDTTSTFVEGSAEIDLDGRATQVSLGYVYALKHRKLTVLAAVNPTGSFEHRERVVPNNNGITPTLLLSGLEEDVTTLALTLPLYVRFNVTKRLDAFGGGAYTYAYARTESTLRSIPTTTSSETVAVDQLTERTSDVFSSSNALYAGAVMTFQSGLTAQAAFQGDLAAINRWTVSLGYRF